MQRDDSLEKLVWLSDTKAVDTYNARDLYSAAFQTLSWTIDLLCHLQDWGCVCLTDSGAVLCRLLSAAAKLAEVNASGLAPGILSPSPLDSGFATYRHQRLSCLQKFLTPILCTGSHPCPMIPCLLSLLNLAVCEDEQETVSVNWLCKSPCKNK